MAIFGIHVYPSLQESDGGSGKLDPGKPRRLGRIDDKQVLDEFLVYCDGTHVLAPIVYRYLPDLRDGESFDGFLRRLLDRRIRPGKVESQYRRAMKKLAGTRKSETTATETRS